MARNNSNGGLQYSSFHDEPVKDSSLSCARAETNIARNNSDISTQHFIQHRDITDPTVKENLLTINKENIRPFVQEQKLKPRAFSRLNAAKSVVREEKYEDTELVLPAVTT